MWWKQTRQVALILTITIVVLIIATVIVLIRFLGLGWTGFIGKTLWDWLGLLIIPAALAVIAFLFNLLQSQREHRLAKEEQEESALQEYLGFMSTLILDKQLLASPPPKEFEQLQSLGQAKTLTVMRRLNLDRQVDLLRFLRDLHLREIFDLEGVNLKKVNLKGSDLKEVNLSGAHLEGARLNGAHLEGARLIGTDLSEAKLNGAKLIGADLSNAVLSGADLSGADLTRATITSEQWTQARSLKGAIMPNGSKYKPPVSLGE